MQLSDDDAKSMGHRSTGRPPQESHSNYFFGRGNPYGHTCKYSLVSWHNGIVIRKQLRPTSCLGDPVSRSPGLAAGRKISTCHQDNAEAQGHRLPRNTCMKAKYKPTMKRTTAWAKPPTPVGKGNKWTRWSIKRSCACDFEVINSHCWSLALRWTFIIYLYVGKMPSRPEDQ